MTKCRDCTGEDTYYRCPSCELKRKMKFNAKDITIDAEMGIKLLSITAAYVDLLEKLAPPIKAKFIDEYLPIIHKLEKLLYQE